LQKALYLFEGFDHPGKRQDDAAADDRGRAANHARPAPLRVDRERAGNDAEAADQQQKRSESEEGVFHCFMSCFNYVSQICVSR
jgi:hypothetical protein